MKKSTLLKMLDEARRAYNGGSVPLNRYAPRSKAGLSHAVFAAEIAAEQRGAGHNTWARRWYEATYSGVSPEYAPDATDALIAREVAFQAEYGERPDRPF